MAIKRNKFLQGLIEDGTKMENEVVQRSALSKLSEKTEETKKEEIEEIVTPTIAVVAEYKAVIEEKPPTQKKSEGLEAFIKERKKEKQTERVVIPTDVRNELKITATALGISLQDLTTNILEDWLRTHDSEIKKAKKRLLG